MAGQLVFNCPAIYGGVRAVPLWTLVQLVAKQQNFKQPLNHDFYD